MTLIEFAQQVFAVATASSACGIPVLRRLTPTSITLRLDVVSGGFVEVFCNEEAGTIAYAFVRQGQRVFGADNAGGWHVHPFADPARHDPLPDNMSFAEFVAAIERRFG
jgi:hypothetical protein